MNTRDVAKAHILGVGIASLSAAYPFRTDSGGRYAINARQTLLVPINAVMLKLTKLTGIRQRATESPLALTPGMAAL